MSRVEQWRPLAVSAKDEVWSQTGRMSGKKVLAFLGCLCLAGAWILFMPKPWNLIAILLCQLSALIPSWLRRRRKRLRHEHEGQSFCVTFRSPQGWAIGSTTGYLIFSEGWLLFEGQACRFSVTRAEAVFATPTSIRFENGYIAVLTNNEGLPLKDEQIKKLVALQTEWQDSPIPDEEAILPPTETHPSVYREWEVLGSLVMAIAIGFGFALGFLEYVILGSLLAGAGMLIGGYCVWHSHQRYQDANVELGQRAPLPFSGELPMGTFGE